MASVIVNLTGYVSSATVINWARDFSLGTTFSANGMEQILIDLSFWESGQAQIRIANDRDFTDAFEATGRILVEASDGETLEIMIANADMDEAYIWFPANSAAVTAFVAHVRGLTDQNATLTLTDDPPATDHAVDGGNLEWGFELPAATVTHTPAPTATVPARPSQPSLVVDSSYANNCHWSGPR